MMPQLLSDEQIVALIAAPDIRTFPGRRDRMILLTFLDTGCRVSELCGMDVKHVSITLIRVMGKGRRERLLAFSPGVQREMLRYLRIRGSLFGEEGPLFPSRKGAGRLCRSRVGRIVVGYAEQAGITDVSVTPHGFRRQYASAFLKGGGSIVHLQQILGHADITMSRRYASVFDADCFEASMNLSPGGGDEVGVGEERLRPHRGPVGGHLSVALIRDRDRSWARAANPGTAVARQRCITTC
jgi:integrase/recombinase XerD